MLSGCSWFSHDEAADTGRRLRFIDVEVAANDNVNPNAAGEAQPVKVCVIETNRSGWMPDGIGDGALPRDGAVGRGAEPAPEHFATEGDAALSLRGAGGARAMGRRGGGISANQRGLPLAEQKSPAQADSQMKVMVGMTSLSIVTNDKMDE